MNASKLFVFLGGGHKFLLKDTCPLVCEMSKWPFGGKAGNAPFSVWITKEGWPVSQWWSGARLLKEAPQPQQASGTDQMALLSYMLMYYLYPRKHFQEMCNLLVLSPLPRASFWCLSLLSNSRLVEAETRQKFGGVGRRSGGSKLRVYRENLLIFKDCIFCLAPWSMFEC